MLDVKEGGRGVFVCSSPGPDPYTSQDLYNPVYEELSNGKFALTDHLTKITNLFRAKFISARRISPKRRL